MMKIRLLTALIPLLFFVGCMGEDALIERCAIGGLPTTEETISQEEYDSGASNPIAVEGANYRAMNICGWKVFISKNLYTTGDAATVYDALSVDLKEVREVVPVTALSRLHEVSVWVDVDVEPAGDPVPDPADDDWSGAVYWGNQQSLIDNGLPLEWLFGVGITNTDNYLLWRQTVQPAMVLHELAHAFMAKLSVDQQNEIETQYNTVFGWPAASSPYHNTETQNLDGSISTVAKHYALTNQWEYFAETTEALFLRNDFYPWDAVDLEIVDPDGFDLVQSLWNSP